MNRRMVSWLALAVLLAALLPVQAGDTGWVNIKQLHEQAQAGWKGSFQVKGRQIDVDLTIHVPDQEQVAMMTVKLPDIERLKQRMPDKAKTHGPVEKDGFLFIEETKNNVYMVNVGFEGMSGGCERWSEEGAQAENSPLTAREAQAFAEDILKTMAGDDDSFTVKLVSAEASSRIYRNLATGLYKSEFPDLDRSMPMTDMGYYTLNYEQVFRGLPLLQSGVYRTPEWEYEHYHRPGGMIRASIASKEDYGINYYPAVEGKVLQEDIPLASLDRVIKEVERMITEGYVAELYDMRLGYVNMLNKDDLGNSFMLMPVWELRGEFVSDPKYPFPSDILPRDTFGSMQYYIHAQTAQFLNEDDQTPGRVFGQVMTWPEVRGK